MDEGELLAERFEAHRGRLRAVAYRMLGSVSEADDAVQEAWLRLSRAEARAGAGADPAPGPGAGSGAVENLGGWLTTVVGRVCLDMLRSRTSRREEPLDVHVPDPVVGAPESADDGGDPEHQALLADSVGLALLVVLETLGPAERLAFVLHDLFAVPYDDIAPVVGRTPAAARQLASRARRRVQGAAPATDADLPRQREIVDAFLAAARGGDFEALVTLLDPDVVTRSDSGAVRPPTLVRGAEAVARSAISYSRHAQHALPALVNGTAGVVGLADGRAYSVMSFTIRNGKITRLDILADPDRLAGLDLSALGA